MFNCLACQGDRPSREEKGISGRRSNTAKDLHTASDYKTVYSILVLPKNPTPDEPFRILVTGGENLRKAQIVVKGPSGEVESVKSLCGDEYPFWRIDDFKGCGTGNYRVTLYEEKQEVCQIDLSISKRVMPSVSGIVWKSARSWDAGMENLYSVWVNALFHDCDENSIWRSLDEVIKNKKQNFLFNYLSMNEEDQLSKNKLVMQPDCADNPFFLRAYFSWKLGLPFGYHECDRGSLSHSPRTGKWITNESHSSIANPVTAFYIFLRQIMNGVHSGTARTALEDETSDYYPVQLSRESLRPGVVYADPYGHTLILVSWIPQSRNHPGKLLSVDAQPDGTVGIKRFWKGNFLFNTSGVVGEPGFKTFRPIVLQNGSPRLLKNKELSASSGYIPFSLQQKDMKDGNFYHSMDRLINTKPLDPEIALSDLIDALYEQLKVRITSVSNGEAYMKSHPGTVVPMPSGAAAIFQAGGQWEDFSTPNRDLRLLIAIDAILDFPERLVNSAEDFNIPLLSSPDKERNKLKALLDQKLSELSISYTRSDGSEQKLTLAEIIKRRDEFEMAYNPNDGIEIRWGAPENSSERASCRRHAPPNQLQTMRSVRPWFHKRLHPPT